MYDNSCNDEMMKKEILNGASIQDKQLECSGTITEFLM